MTVKKKKTKVVMDSVVLIVEGETEVEFYKRVLIEIRNNYPDQAQFKMKFKLEKPVNMRGIGKFQNNALAQFENIKNKNDGKLKNVFFKYHVFLCIDTDVFYYNQNPPLNKEKLKTELLRSGAESVSYIQAEKSIEDWFLYDLDGIMSFLKLKKISEGYKKYQKGADKLDGIFKQANKTYIKGCKSEGFVEHLNIKKIMQNYSKELEPLTNIFD